MGCGLYITYIDREPLTQILDSALGTRFRIFAVPVSCIFEFCRSPFPHRPRTRCNLALTSMKILVLTFGILVMLSFRACETDTNPTPISDTYNPINNTGNLPIAKQNCSHRCGDLIVPYPFGVGLDTNCSIGYGFDIYCNTSSNPHKAFFHNTSQYGWIKNISDSTLRLSNLPARKCYNLDGEVLPSVMSSDFIGSPYTLSQVNRFTVLGCDDYAWLVSGTESRNERTGCMVFCSNDLQISSDRCPGNGCCQSPIPQDINYYTTELQTLNSCEMNSARRCTYAFVGEEDTFKYNGAARLDSSLFKYIEENVPVVLDWVVGNMSCAEAKETQGYACQSNSTCVDSTRESGGYRCQCKEGYEGNPYLSPGCQDIDECKDSTKYPCYGYCINTPGNYTCNCNKGYSGDATVLNGCQKTPQKSFHQSLLFYLGVSLSTGVLFLVAISYALYKLYKLIRKTKDKRQRKKFFKRNGGILLKQQAEADPSLVDKTILFTSRELAKATDDFNETRVLGRGGQGTVYKGMLVDGRIVAIKKSKLVDESQLKHFINEVVILSQINHRNVVKLLGCCLETDVPLLVSEFISNGTLYDRLHNDTDEFSFSLNMRIQIAIEVAGAVAYLHSATSIPIYHRDIKTTNILLDDKYRAKVSDFGTSRLVSVDQTHLTTMVKGTFGYLDPEYFQSSQFTEKSDVYSFGVVLVELITGEKPISLTRFGEHRSLATYFTIAMEEGRVMSIFDAKMIKEATRDELLLIAKLAMRCLNMNGKNRPTMKEVVVELETIQTSHIPSTVQTNTSPMIYGEELSKQPYGESTSTFSSMDDNIRYIGR